MKIAVLAIGLPGSGKTTVLKPLAEKYDLAYINRDDIREELLGSAEDQSQNKAVWVEANRRTEEALKDKKGVVLDATFVEAWKRKEAVTFLRKAGAEKVFALFFDVPRAIAMERNQNRDRVVSESIITWMHDRLTASPPAVTDGFDALYTLNQLDLLEKEIANA